MIRSLILRKMIAIFHHVAGVSGAEEIIDSPAYVPLTSAGAHAPPSVIIRFFVKFAKAIHIAMFNQLIQPSPFKTAAKTMAAISPTFCLLEAFDESTIEFNF